MQGKGYLQREPWRSLCAAFLLWLMLAGASVICFSEASESNKGTALNGNGSEIVPALVLELPDPEGGRFANITILEDPKIGPHEESYLYLAGSDAPVSYADPSITVNIGTGRIEDTNFMYARVKIANAAQIRTMMATSSLQSSTTAQGHSLAKRANAVIAINGVLEADNMVKGPVVLQGQKLRPDEKTGKSRLNTWKRQKGMDTLVIDDQGNLRILEAEKWGTMLNKITEMGSSAVNVISFGPALIVDGEPRYGYSNRQMSTHRLAQRMALCQTGPLEYLLITSEGPEDPGSTGLTMDQFTALITTFFPDVQTAYNLDGGSSSTLIFRKGKDYWAKINCPRSSKKRALRDIIYFADAWIPEE